MVTAPNPVEVYFIEALALFCFCPPPSIFERLLDYYAVVSSAYSVLVRGKTLVVLGKH